VWRLVGPQPVTIKTIVQRRLALLGVPAGRIDDLRDDVLTEPSDVQTMFDNIPVADKKLQWIDGTTRRRDGYLEFQRRPEPMLEWYAKHMD
jgi:hypothetical protein